MTRPILARSLLPSLLACAAALPLPGRAEPLPQWELGVGVTAFRLPDYRGSDESRNYLYPFPYLVYRGERVRVDRQGARAVLFESTRAEIDFSASREPLRDGESRIFDGRKTHGKRLQTAKGKAAVVG